MNHIPATLELALSIPSPDETFKPTYVAGATDIMPLLKNHVRTDNTLVLLKKIPELKEIRDDGEHIILGAGVTLLDVAENEMVSSVIPAVSQAASVTASPQIRNIATIGGNIMQDRRCIYFNQTPAWRSAFPLCFKTNGTVCHQIPNSPVCRAIYYSDVATGLLLYDAEVDYYENNELHTCPLSELISRHIEANGLACNAHLPILLIRFRIRKPEKTEHSGFCKYAMRSTIDFPLINFSLRCRGNRPAKIVAGAVSIEPVILPETAALLNREDVSDDAIINACCEELKKLSKPIKEACISPVLKKNLFKQIYRLLYLRHE